MSRYTADPANTSATEHPVLHGERVTLRPLAAAEVPRLAEEIAADETTAPWWGTDADEIAGWLTDEDAHVFAIDVGDTTVGVIMYEEENDPDYRHAGIDLSVLAPYSGRGLGPDALRTLARHLFDMRGHHRIHIDPAAKNARAIRAYEKVGFKPVGIMRRYERGPDGEWRDGLLMDLLAEELTGETGE